MTDDLQQARVTAAARALDPIAWAQFDRMSDADQWPSRDLIVDHSLARARAALAAADAHLPSVEMIAEVVGGIRLDAAECREDYFCDEVVADHAMDIATAVRALFGEVAGDE